MEKLKEGSLRSSLSGVGQRQREVESGSAFQSLADAGHVWRWVVTVEGVGRHVSTTVSDRSRDALLSATRFIEVVNRAARSEASGMTWSVRRVPQLHDVPNASTVVLMLELRGTERDAIEGFFDRIVAEGRVMGRLGGTAFSFVPVGQTPSTVGNRLPAMAVADRASDAA